MSKLHWVSPCGKVIEADSPLPSVSRPRMSGPQLFSFEAETFSVTTVCPVLLVMVKFCWAPPAGAAPVSPPAVLPPAGAAGAAGAAAFEAAGAAALLVVAALLQPAMASAEANRAPVR